MKTGELQATPSAADGDVSAPRVVLFDFDGVLVCGDSFRLFMHDRYARAWWRKLLAVLALPWLLLCLPFSRRRAIVTLVHIGLCGVNGRHYHDLAMRFAATLARRPRQFCRDGLRRLRQHQADGDRVLVVTGCEETLARAVLAELGLDGLEVVASTLRPGWSGMRMAHHNVGRRKVEALAALGITAGATAYSDSSQDIPMLKLAAAPVLVNATPAICKRVERALGRSVARIEWY